MKRVIELVRFMNGLLEVLSKQFSSVDAERLKQILGVFYFLQLAISYQSLSYNAQMPSWQLLVDSKRFFDPLWPVVWAGSSNYPNAVMFILLGFLISSVLAAFFWQKYRWTRILAFIFFLNYIALISSFGKIDHYLHLALIASLLLIFLPRGFETDKKVKNALQIFWGVQFFIFMTYSISGFFKIYGIFDQLIKGQVSALSPNSLALNGAKTIFQSGQRPLLFNFISEHPGYWFSILLIAGYFLEFSALAFAFLPRFHRAYGMVLMLFHVGILITVGPDFYYQLIIVGLFIFFSPFQDVRDKPANLRA